MKKIFVILVAAGLLAACDNAGNTAADIKDSADSVKNEKIESVENAADQATDTIEKNTEAYKEKVDSVAGAAKDSLRK